MIHPFPAIGTRTMRLNARRLYRPGNRSEQILLAIEDITEQKAREAALQAAYDREHRIAEALQRSLTLEVPETAFPGLRVATLYEAARAEARVGGDYVDAFALPRDKVALVVADASGKGLQGAVRVAQVREVLRAFLREYP